MTLIGLCFGRSAACLHCYVLGDWEVFSFAFHNDLKIELEATNQACYNGVNFLGFLGISWNSWEKNI